MKKHAVWKHISLLLAVIILFMAMPFPKVNALAASSSAELENANIEPIQQELEPILTESQLPAYIDYSGAVAAKHVERLESEEKLDTLVFRNQNGTYTTYLFDLPIKYVAEDGSIQEKDISLVQSSTAYEVASNDISFNPNDNACLWTIRYDAEGHYYFVPFCALDSLLAVQNSSTENSANVVIQNANYNADNQRWYLEKCSEADIQIYDNNGIIYNSSENYILNINESLQLLAIFLGNSNNQNFTWISSNENIIEINQGQIITKQYGTSTITIKHISSNVQKQITFTVPDPNEAHYEALAELFDLAQSYSPSTNDINQIYLSLQFIRRNIYNSSLWSITAGNIDENFVSYVISNKPYLADFFDGKNNKFIYDSNGNEIDFYHLCATLNGFIFLDNYPNFISDIGKNFAGWAGDLQQCIPIVMDALPSTPSYNQIYIYVFQNLNSGTLQALDNSDLMADVDANNIYIQALFICK